jgi:soluble lytic murein transglycosylase-like protein
MSKKIGTILFMIFMMTGTAMADIYSFIDSQGVLHFTNVPTSSNYKLYIKENSEEKRHFSTGTDAYDDIIRKAQKKYGVEFSLIKAVIHVESNFNPRAVSRKGAKGLMQIMPDNFESLLVEDPFNPAQNIMGGVCYLHRLLKRYERKLPLVLAAYNAGPDAVDRYQQIPPYKETRDYVQKVMKTYSRYKDS